MKYGQDDYLIIQIDKKKYFGMAYSKGKLLLESSATSDDPETVRFKSENIIANLGQNPVNGKVFGVDVTVYQRDLKAEGWPVPIHVYRELGKKEPKIVVKAFKKAQSIMAEQDCFVWSTSLKAIKLIPNSGKMQGSYSHKNGKEGPMDTLTCSATDLTNSAELTELVLHESCHGIWFRQVPRDYRARWSALFNKRSIVNRTTQDELDTLADVIIEFAKTGSRLAEIMKELKSENPDELDALKEVISYVKKIHHIDKEEFEALAVAKPEKFKELWPEVADFSTFKADVTEYATTNVKEFFAESMTYYLLDRSLPKDVKSACKHTLKNLINKY